MRVALITHYMPPHTGGVEQVAELLAHTYVEAGHEVTWIATAAPERAGDTREGALLRRRITAWNLLEERLAMPFPLLGPRAWSAVGAAVADADAVHLHDCLYPTSLAASRAARRRGRPVLVTQHVAMVSFVGGVVDPALAFAYRTVGAGVLRHARRVAFVSESVRDWFARSVPGMAGAVVPNAVDTASFRIASGAERDGARRALGVPEGRAVVLFAGRLVPKKDLRGLVAALPADAHLLVVGDGPERDALAVLGDRVTHVGRVPHERMRDAYAASDLFALPSHGEGLPLSLIEALASGLPCVLSDDPAFAPLASCDGVSRPSRAQLASAIAGALAEPAARRAARGAASRAWAEERYGLAAFRDRYLALLSEVAGP